MQDEGLYPELLDYIYNYCEKYFTENERKGHKYLHALFKSDGRENARIYKFIMKEEDVSENQEILELTKDGIPTFVTKVATRIFDEHKNELQLNLCPKCSKIARTPRAKQCQFCYHDWH